MLQTAACGSYTVLRKFGMELHTNKPRVRFNFNNFHQVPLRDLFRKFSVRLSASLLAQFVIQFDSGAGDAHPIMLLAVGFA
jgi:hypothetical protein